MNKPSAKIRAEFLDFFKEQGCKTVPSDSLIPSGDKTLLFTSAGMVQFKQHFLGQSNDTFTRAASCQKCFRTSDIENVGITSRHLTFFEMLGNFSFGDYFKKEAIAWAYEFLTKNMSLPKDKLYFTVYKDDDEAAEIWKKLVPFDRIIKMGEDTNFWNMGDTGPCGPCSEILIDLGEDMSCGKPDCGPACSCDRHLEIWNLVFTQFDKQPDGSLKPLPRKNIDTGMGLERIVAAANGKKSIFETDLFMPIIENAADILKIKAEGKNISKLRMIADHSRAVTFLISDGVLPSNEGRGYVLRRILRRALRAGKLFGYNKPFISDLSDSVFKIMEPAYPELSSKLANIKSIIKIEEEKFLETLESGSNVLNNIINAYQAKKASQLSGEDVFKLYDTYGFPYDLTKEIAAESGLTVDEKGFKRQQKAAQEKSRAAWGGSGEKDVTFYSILHKKTGDTEFTGYNHYTSLSKVLAVIKDSKEVSEIASGDTAEVVFDKTPFYALSGGQSSDKGFILNDNFKAEVIDVVKPIGNLFVHKIKVLDGVLKTGDKVNADINIERRKQIARHHTATHLLHKALREAFGEHITQAGSLVAPDYLRFDFTHFAPVKKEDLIKIENRINAVIRANMPVNIESMDINKARKHGAMALFGEKYGEVVRTVTVVDNDANCNFSMELCGGTHIERTGDIGFFKIVSESSVAAGVRRIEAVAGFAAENYVLNEENNILKTAELLSVSKDEILNKTQKILADYKKLEQELNTFKSSLISADIDNYVKEAKDVNGIKFLTVRVADVDVKSLRDMSDKLKEKLKSAVILIVSKSADKASFIVSVTADNVDKGFNAGKIAKSFAAEIGGSGGGKPDFAQGGAKDLSKIDVAIKNVEKYLK
ncbi:alanine--tRNA ligase [Endomicrobium proavitum]|uniref:Alanine--tRNA ligase n=1 Tax=Endomicrobium proavitum TaxID=1408281 RepID=A0A0G3WHZ1_9BACT|nr:alanine--tRNA ligase [Endomicrobium proavitum]AKL97490.1 Alanine--tRNA ligase [Endomicrobium proavitum]